MSESLSKINFKEALQLLSDLPGCENYHDTLLGQSEEYLSNYQFFKSGNDVFGISPEKNIHLYSVDEGAALSFLRHVEEAEISPEVIFSFYKNDSFLRQNLKSRDLTARPFYSLKKVPVYSESLNHPLECRRATTADQSIVNLWYENFNNEEASSWAVPDLLKEPDHKLYLFFLNSEFVGAAANTLQSAERLWIGRLWIDPKARKKGLGTLIMQQLENVAAEENKITSLLVANSNEKALGLYSKLGYQIVSSNCYWY